MIRFRRKSDTGVKRCNIPDQMNRQIQAELGKNPFSADVGRCSTMWPSVRAVHDIILRFGQLCIPLCTTSCTTDVNCTHSVQCGMRNGRLRTSFSHSLCWPYIRANLFAEKLTCQLFSKRIRQRKNWQNISYTRAYFI